jgi:uncharacterized RDD family membrane protein YckC
VNFRTNTLLLRTPEGIVFSQVLASPVTRFLAWSVDLVLLLVTLVVLNNAMALLWTFTPDLGMALAILLYFVLSIGYAIAAEWYWRGQTFGKRLFRLRVVDVQGLRLHASQIIIRNLLRAVDALPVFYLVGGAACLLSRRGQRLGDLAANTVVIRHLRVAQPDLDQIMAGKYNSLRDYPHLEARLRQRVSPLEADLALSAVLRSPRLEPAGRLELFEEMAAHFRAKVSFPPEATAGLSDEQYVRNVVDVLYRTRPRESARTPVAAETSPAQAP